MPTDDGMLVVHLFYSAVNSFDRPVIVALVVMFAYLLGFSVLFLDIVYALIDPRVRAGKNGASVRKQAFKKRKLADIFKRKNTVLLHHSPKKFFSDELEVEESNGKIPDTKKAEGAFKRVFKTIRSQILKYPSVILGLVVILMLLVVSIDTVMAIPYDEAVTYWHSDGWLLAPRLARPLWTNWFRCEKWPESLYFDTLYDEKYPFVTLMWLTPDGREMEIDSFAIPDRKGYILSHEDIGIVQSEKLPFIQRLLGDPEKDMAVPLKGLYEFQVLAFTFEPDSNVEMQAALHGKVFGLFGTDSMRRDLTTAMMWGTPVALTFGVIGAITTTITTILIAAISAWYGGVVDEILQRITELNVILPALPIVMMVYLLYSKSIWVILGIMILMNIFGHSLKEYRAMFLQLKESPYVEGAMAYGATDWRIITRYLLPRIVQIMVPQLVISLPSFVFLESTLAFLGGSRPICQPGAK
jgi:peptide/nickel transport system permease protein